MSVVGNVASDDAVAVVGDDSATLAVPYAGALIVGDVAAEDSVPAGAAELAGIPELNGVWGPAGGADVVSGTLPVGRDVTPIVAVPVALGPASPAATEPLGPAVGNAPVAVTPP